MGRGESYANIKNDNEPEGAERVTLGTALATTCRQRREMRERDWSNQRYKRGNFGQNFVTCCDPRVNTDKMYSPTCRYRPVGKIRQVNILSHVTLSK